jgi:hypothetical protein
MRFARVAGCRRLAVGFVELRDHFAEAIAPVGDGMLAGTCRRCCARRRGCREEVEVSGEVVVLDVRRESVRADASERGERFVDAILQEEGSRSPASQSRSSSGKVWQRSERKRAYWLRELGVLDRRGAAEAVSARVEERGSNSTCSKVWRSIGSRGE